MPNYDLGTKRKKISPYLLIAAIAVLLVLIAYLLGLLSGGGLLFFVHYGCSFPRVFVSAS